MIKFYSINKSDLKIRNKILKSIKYVIKNNNFINGSEVKKFEKILAHIVVLNMLFLVQMEQMQLLVIKST